jgi:hypothetical protein
MLTRKLQNRPRLGEPELKVAALKTGDNGGRARNSRLRYRRIYA